MKYRSLVGLAVVVGLLGIGLALTLGRTLGPAPEHAPKDGSAPSATTNVPSSLRGSASTRSTTTVRVLGPHLKPVPDAVCTLHWAEDAPEARSTTGPDGVSQLIGAPLRVPLTLKVTATGYRESVRTVQLDRPDAQFEVVLDAPEAQGTLRGQVRDEAGQPLRGVYVVAEVGPGGPATLTGPEGTYEIAGLSTGSTVRVTYSLAGFAWQEHRVRIDPGSTLDVVLVAAVRVTVYLHLPEAQSEGHAALNFIETELRFDGQLVWTGPAAFRQGNAQFPFTRQDHPKSVEVVVRFGREQHSAQGVFSKLSDRQSDATVELPAIPAHRVRVSDHDGVVANANIWGSLEGRTHLFSTDARGVATVLGSWADVMFWSSRGVARVGPIPVTGVEVIHVRLDAGDASRIRLTPAKSSADAGLSLDRRDGGGVELSREWIATEDGGGALELAVPPGNYRVKRGPAILTDYVLRVGLRESIEYRLPLEEGGGRLTGRTAPKASVALWRLDLPSPAPSATQTAKPDGAFEFSELWEGRYLVTALDTEGDGRSEVVAVLAGQTTDVGELKLAHDLPTTTIVFENADGTPYAQMDVTLGETPFGVHPLARQRTDPYGILTFRVRRDVPICISTAKTLALLPRSAPSLRVVLPPKGGDVHCELPEDLAPATQALWLSHGGDALVLHELPFVAKRRVALPARTSPTFLVVPTPTGCRFLRCVESASGAMEAGEDRLVLVSGPSDRATTVVARCTQMGGMNIEALRYRSSHVGLRDGVGSLRLPRGCGFVLEFRSATGTLLEERSMRVD